MESLLDKKFSVSQNLKVVQLIDSLDPGGAERMAVQIANGLIGNNVSSFLVSSRKKGVLKNQISSDVEYYCLQKRNTFDFRAYRHLYKIIKINKISIIHAHSSSVYMGLAMKLINPQLKLVWHDHFGRGDELKKRSFFILRFFRNFIALIISVNVELQQWAKSKIGHQRVAVLENFSTLLENSKNIDSIKLNGIEAKRIVCVANLRPQKNHLLLLNSFNKISQNCPGWTLHLVGVDFENSYSNSLKKFVTKNRLEHHVFFYGAVQNVALILSQSDIGVLSSKSEGLPVTLLEYGLAKLPVLVTDVGDCSKVIEDSVNGFIVQSNSEPSFQEKLFSLMTDINLRNSFGVNLYETVNNNFGKEKYMKALKSLYAKL